jgi:hypothetical protein
MPQSMAATAAAAHFSLVPVNLQFYNTSLTRSCISARPDDQREGEGTVTATLVYSDEWAGYAYSSHHPLKPVRLQLTYELMQAYDLLQVDRCRTLPAAAAAMSELSRFHTVEYLEVLRAASEGQEVSHSAHYGLGPGDNPIFPGMFRFSALIAGASLQAAQVVDAGAARVAFNMAGGLHHGMPARASGFCYLNDVVLAIKYLLDMAMGCKPRITALIRCSPSRSMKAASTSFLALALNTSSARGLAGATR